MALMKWEPTPFKGIADLKKEMDRIFDSFFGERLPFVKEEFEFAPSVDVSETENEIIVKATVPGVDKKDLNITLTEGSITIKGEVKKEKEEKKKNYYRQEISYGSFSRTIPLPVEVKTEDAKASLKDGVLEVVLPKSEKAKTKEIKINVE